MGNTAVLYGIKLARLSIIYVAAAIAVRIQEAKYVEEVYGKDAKPPPLTGLVFTIVAFMLVFNGLLLAGIGALGNMGFKMFEKKRFRQLAQSETIIYTLFVIGAGYFVARIVERKKYLNYRQDGMRALRATRELLMALVVPISVVPIFFAT